MIADIKPYAQYKESGLAWLGQVPGHWMPTKLKHAFSRIIGGSTPASGNATYWNGDVTWVTPADVSRSERLRRSIRQISRAGMVSCSTQLVPKDSIILTTRAPVGNVSIADVELCTNQGCKALIPDSNVIAPMFGFWLLSVMKAEIQSLSTGTTFSEVSTTRLGSTVGILPPPAEQAAIVRFLDWANGRLERAIRAKRKVIALLGEQKQAIIHRAVTRGLDPSVPLKPSGIPWLGDIPQHWEVISLRMRYSVELGKMLDAKRITGRHSVPYLRNRDVQWDRIVTDDLPVMDIPPNEVARYTVKRGDLLVCEGGQVGRSAFWNETLPVCGFQKALHRVRALDGSRDCSRFFFYQMQLAARRGVFTADGNENTIAHLTCEKLRRHRFAFPPVSEQTAVAEHLDGELRQFQTAISRLEREIELLLEYRTRLVADVVTGKLDVREAALRLPDEAPPDTAEDDAELSTDPDTRDEEAAV